MKATFTLTNAVPLFTSSKNGWEDYEDRVSRYAKCPCGSLRDGTLYLLTGISDFGLTVAADGRLIRDVSHYHIMSRYLQGRLRLDTPRALWTAGCCVWKESESDKAESFAFMTNNRDNPDLLHQTEMSVAKLEGLLTTSPSFRVNLFPGKPKCRNPDNLDFKIPL